MSRWILMWGPGVSTTPVFSYPVKVGSRMRANNVHEAIGSLNRRILFFVRCYALYNLFVGLQLGNIGQIMTDI